MKRHHPAPVAFLPSFHILNVICCCIYLSSLHPSSCSCRPLFLKEKREKKGKESPSRIYEMKLLAVCCTHWTENEGSSPLGSARSCENGLISELLLLSLVSSYRVTQILFAIRWRPRLQTIQILIIIINQALLSMGYIHSDLSVYCACLVCHWTSIGRLPNSN